jgi:ATP/maltotriose-dependent transcriptional regulator MalT
MFVKDDGRMRVYLDQARAVGDEWLGATAWLMTAGMAENYGNVDEMRVPAAEALDRFRALGERWGLSTALRTIGNIQVLDGDLDGAVAAFTEASHLLAELGHREDLSQVQLRLAEIAARRGDLAKARQLSAAARSAVESEGSPMDRGIAAAWWAAFEARWGDVDAARPHQAAAERHLAQFGPAHPAREHLEALVAATGARIAIADKDLRAAREQVVRSYRAAIAAEDMPLLAQASGTTAELALALGQPERAAELLGAGAVARGADDPTDPTALQLVPLLRACLGDDRYEASYASGRTLARPDAIERLDPAGLG